MSCKCFKTNNPPDNRKSFSEKVELSKCKCESRLVVSERKSRFYIDSEVNKSLIDKIKIDGFLDNSTEKPKCDYLFIYKNLQNVELTYVFVELKGTDVKHAVEQLDNSIDTFYTQGYLNKKQVRGAIVFSVFPKDSGTYRNAKRTLYKKIQPKIKDFRLEEKSKNMGYNPISDKFH